MATWTVSNNYVSLSLTVTETATNVSQNNSTVSWSLTLTASNISCTNRAVSWNVNIGGMQRAEISTVTASQGQTVTLGSGSGTITHNADGSKTISCSAHAERSGSWSISWSALSISESLALTTLARYATPSVSPASLVCSGDAEFIVSFTYASADYYYLLTITIPNKAELYRTILHGGAGAQAAISYKPPRNVVQYFASNATQNPIQFNLVTYTDSSMTTVLGQTARQATLKSSQQYHAPKFDASEYAITESNLQIDSLLTDKETAVALLSEKVVYCKAESDYGATISSITISNGAQTVTGTSLGSGSFYGELTNLVSGKFTFKATDSRGYTVNGTYGEESNFIDYCLPTITAKVDRVTPTGSAVTAKLSGNVFDGYVGSLENTYPVIYEWKLNNSVDTWHSGSEELTISPDGAGATTYDDTFILSTQFDYDKQYRIRFILDDEFSHSESAEIVIFEGIPVFSWGKDHFDIYGTLHVHPRDATDSSLTVIRPGEKAVRIAQYAVDSSTFSGNSDNVFSCTIPGDASEILAVIPHGCTSKSSWDTVGYLGLVSITGTSATISVHTIGSRSQAYVIRYTVIYK